jgi:hydrogenase expression/formation protein HypC
MCLSIPAKITEVYTEGTLIMGKVDFGGVLKEVCLEYVPEAKAGQYVLVHVGFAISVLDEDEALETIGMLREMASLDEELNPDEVR